MGSDTIDDRKMLEELTKEQIFDMFLLHIRSVWAVDGLYFLGIEEKYGTEGATDIDQNVWKNMAKIEAKRLKKCLNISGNDLASMLKALRATSWSLDIESKEIIMDAEGKKAVFRNLDCRTQKTRIRKGLGEFPCKRVRFGYLEAFAQEFNPNIEVVCKACPPDHHPDNLWCEWEFSPKA
jgi:hypothetical protein